MAIKDKAFDYVQKMAERVQTLFQNRIIAAILLLFQGINFILNPDKAMTDMVKSVAMTVAVAAFMSSIGSLTAKEKNSATRRSLMVSVLLLAGSILCWLKPQGLDIYLRYAIAIFVVYTGASNIFQSLRLERLVQVLSKTKESTEGKLREVRSKITHPLSTEETRNLESTLEHSFEEHIEKRLDPVNRLRNRFSGSTVLSLVLQIMMVLLGIMLLIFPFETNAVMMTSSGIIMVLTSISDFGTALHIKKTMKA